VDVGPYRVLVTGTRFDVGWEPTAERFALRLEQGTVRVSGPLIGADRPVSAGESVAADGKLGRVEILDDRGGVGASSAPAPAPVGPTASASSPATPPSGAFPAPEPSSPRPAGWRELAAAGRYKDALGAAERAGFEAECACASASDLVALGDAARLGGNAGRAAQALLALRSRFPGDGRSATAAFTLGRIAFDQRRSPCEAARWFDAYLREQGGGAFAREAAGRLIEARRACGDAAGAREAAKRYLSRFPNGPHAELARSLPPE
jgi:TolA-binding protein